MALTFELKKTYNFNIVPNAVSMLGDKYTLMKVLAILTADQAVRYGTDVATQHEQLKPVITGLPESISDLTFILFQTQNGDNVIYANEYINPDSIVEVEGINIQARVYNANTEDIAIIKARLLELGYTNISMSTFES